MIMIWVLLIWPVPTTSVAMNAIAADKGGGLANKTSSGASESWNPPNQYPQCVGEGQEGLKYGW